MLRRVIAGKIAAMLIGLPPNESKQSVDQARQIFIGLQQGKIDRSLFTENCNAYFDAQALGDFESSSETAGRADRISSDGKGIARRHDLPRLRCCLRDHACGIDNLPDAGRKN